MVETPFPQLDELLMGIGEAGKRLSDINACEAAAGNISIYFSWPLEIRHRFPLVEEITLPLEVPELAGSTFIVSGSGTRLRDSIVDPGANLGCLVVNEGGSSAQLYSSHNRLFKRLTSEFNSHLAVHYDRVLTSGTNFHAVVHAQPPHITYLSHVSDYLDEQCLNQQLMRWQPETILTFPDGMGIIPFCVPGSEKLMKETVLSLRERRLTIWAKHGVVARSDTSTMQASDLIEYIEAAAHYEYLNLINGAKAPGMLPDEIRAICATYNVKQKIY